MPATLDLLPFRVDLSGLKGNFDDRWPCLALEALAKSLGLKVMAGGSFGYSGEAPKGNVTVGVRVNGFKKNEMVVSYAGFTRAGKLIAASPDLGDGPNWHHPTRLAWRDASSAAIPLDLALRKRIKEAAGGPRAPTAAPPLLGHAKDVDALAATADGSSRLGSTARSVCGTPRRANGCSASTSAAPSWTRARRPRTRRRPTRECTQSAATTCPPASRP